MISYAKHKTKPSILEYSTSFSIFLGDSRTHSKSFFWYKKESSGEVRTFLQGSRTFHDELFFISR